ncbi:hypothetical protein D7V82_15425 [bacterium 1xD8-6]|nr:hypothetical protein D7V72_11035 [bacterium D16-36]RKI66113.1 hypothetical protein D7V82_15425 [bacterium 1xD8-6]
MTDWLMVIITAIYVVATIIICYFNGKSAKAAKIQTDEMIRQYNLANRPNVTIHFDIIRSGLLCFIIENEGASPAHNIRININRDFLKGVNEEVDKNRLESLADSELYLASKQKIYILLGGQLEFSKLAQNVAEIDISYDGYEEHTTIDLNQYGMMLVYSSPLEDISQHMKKMKENDERFQKKLLKCVGEEYPVQNIVVHSETIDEANKYKIFKAVCCERKVTTNFLAENMGLEKDYILQLLIELECVDRLVSHFNADDDYEAEWYRK